MNFWAASVITTCTSSAWRCKARTSSAALYAAMPPETPTVTFIAMIVTLLASSPVLRLSLRVQSNVVSNPLSATSPWAARRLDLARGDLFLGDAAGLVGAGINQRLRAILKLPGATGCHDHVAKIAVKSMFWRHLASCRRLVAGHSGAGGVHVEQTERGIAPVPNDRWRSPGGIYRRAATYAQSQGLVALHGAWPFP